MTSSKINPYYDWCTYEQITSCPELKPGSIILVRWKRYLWHSVAYIGGKDHICYHVLSLDKSASDFNLKNIMNPRTVDGVQLVEPLKMIMWSDGEDMPPFKVRIDKTQLIENNSSDLMKKPRSKDEMIKLAEKVAYKRIKYNMLNSNCELHSSAFVYGSNPDRVDIKEGWCNQKDVLKQFSYSSECNII